MSLRNCIAASVLLLVFSAPAIPQQATGTVPSDPMVPQSGVPPIIVDPDRDARSDPKLEEIERDQQKKLNKSRQEALKRDTDKLLQLANELKQYVDKTNENVLSLDVIHKAEQIEKLAKSVRDKMKSQ